MCVNAGSVVLQCGEGMESIYYFKYQDRSTVAKHYAGMVPIIVGTVIPLGIPWTFPWLNFGFANAQQRQVHSAMEALHAGDWDKGAQLMLEQCTNFAGVLAKRLHPFVLHDCWSLKSHPEVGCRRRLGIALFWRAVVRGCSLLIDG
jgi:hypothetical protein